ncbi:hypothetical protein FKW77_004370 [Venturia effusa]|uniref:Aminoglycoside phosphotransferase domain-containing protein n=1 Tax=Venturia effusa TaxID=50376 RepID=A0A517LDL0_9PEZI|nr:hypothetical protein FKW77_004370 [Venturia effusa]
MDLSQLHLTATDDELIMLCHTDACRLLSGNLAGNRVVQISTVAVIKFGIGVTKEEFANQYIAYQQLDPTIVRVPRAYRYIQRDSIGFIVMEFIQGRQINVDDIATYATKLNSILAHFSEHRSQVPGPFNGGQCRGIIWPDSEEIIFSKRQDLEIWLNTRLRLGRVDETINLGDFDLIMCHMDFVGRNILALADGSLCVLDWAHAGYYPHFFERLVQDFAPSDRAFCSTLARTCSPLSVLEEKVSRLVAKACSNSQSYFL